jgi:hypothetical protein
MAITLKTTGSSGLGEAARRFLMGLGDDLDHDYEGLSLMEWNELDHLSFRGDDDEPYYAGAEPRLSARQLVERFGAEFLKLYKKEHGKDAFPAWHYRFNGGDDANGE